MVLMVYLNHIGALLKVVGKNILNMGYPCKVSKSTHKYQKRRKNANTKKSVFPNNSKTLPFHPLGGSGMSSNSEKILN